MIDLIKYMIYIALSAVAFYFIAANLSLIKDTNLQGIESEGQLDPNALPAFMPKYSGHSGIEKDIESYGHNLLNQSSNDSKRLSNQITTNLKFKDEVAKEPDDKTGILNKFLKYASSFKSTSSEKAPSLENFDDYAPQEVPGRVTTSPVSSTTGSIFGSPSTPGVPILATNKTVPNYLDIKKNEFYDKNNPLAINEYDTHRPANFQSERTTPWSEKISSDNISFTFEKNPFKSFDEISKSDIVDPAEWDRIVKKKESASPLLSLSAMKPDDRGFMPSNHYETSQKYSNLC